MTSDPLGDGIARLRTMRAAPRAWPNVRRDLDAGLREVAQGRRGADALDELVGLLERADGGFEAAALGMYPPGEEEFREMAATVAEATRRSALALTLCAWAAAASRKHDRQDNRVVEPLRRAAALLGTTGADIWTAWLEGSPPDTSARNALMVASCNPVGGLAGRMTVERIDEPELVMHPRLALRPLGAQLLASVRAAWAGTIARHEGLGHGVVWNLEFDDPRGFQGDGDSLGLAAAIAFGTTVRGLRCDGDVLVAGALCPSCQGLDVECCGPHRAALAEVGGLTDKVDAARALGTPARRIVTPGYRAAGNPPTISGLPVTYTATLDEAIDALSVLRHDLSDLFREIRDAPDRSPAPYLGGRRLSEVFIWQDVLVDEPEADAAQTPDGEALADAGRISEANRETGEGPTVAPEAPRRRTWREIEARLLAPGADRSLLLQGAAGSGKSSHLAMVAAAIAERAERALQDATTPDEVPLVVPVALESLTRIPPTLRPETEALLAAQVLEDDRLFQLRRRLVHHLEGRGATARAATYLAARVHEERCWLLLDALDQADLGQLDRLFPTGGGEGTDRLGCRVIVSTRPGGPIPRAFAAAPRARLADLTDPQVEHYVHARFADEDRRKRIMAMLESPAVADLCRNPFLLTLTSWVADRDQLPGDVTRNVLLEFVLRKLLGWDPRTSTEDADRADAWLRTLPRIAFELLRPDPARQSVRRAALARAIAANGHSPPPQKLLPDRARRIDEAEVLATELVRRGVLVDDEPDEENHAMLRWPHRLFAEFLAAEGMAQILCGENEPTSGLS